MYILHQNLCASNPCLNNGTCFTGYTSKKYLCVCTERFTGENCEQASGKIVIEDITWLHGCTKLKSSCGVLRVYSVCTSDWSSMTLDSTVRKTTHISVRHIFTLFPQCITSTGTGNPICDHYRADLLESFMETMSKGRYKSKTF